MISITAENRAKLQVTSLTPGYRVLLDIGDRLCTVWEGKLLAMDRAAGHSLEQIASAQEQARAARLYFESLQKEVIEQIGYVAPAEEPPDTGHAEEPISEFRLDEEIRREPVPARGAGDADANR